jgi:hypothetical protein
MNPNKTQKQSAVVWLHDMLIGQYNRKDSVTVILFPLLTSKARKTLNRMLWGMEDRLERPLSNLEEAVAVYKVYAEECGEPDSYLRYALVKFIRNIQEKEVSPSFLN